jgi:hypothetical protein
MQQVRCEGARRSNVSLASLHERRVVGNEAIHSPLQVYRVNRAPLTVPRASPKRTPIRCTASLLLALFFQLFWR